MQSPTHALLGVVAFGRTPPRGALLGATIGALLPDAFMVPLMIYGFTKGLSESLWEEVYWQEPWQTMGAISNSFFLWAAIAVVGWLWRRRTATSVWGPLLMAVGCSALLHVGFDFAVHADDAHRHFWPVSSWRFYSPVSYWDVDHNAKWFMPVEAIIAIGSALVLLRRASTNRATWAARIGLGYGVIVGLVAVAVVILA